MFLFNNAQQGLTVHLNKRGVKGPLIEALKQTLTLSDSLGFMLIY